MLEYIFVDPPTIHEAIGTKHTGYKLFSTKKQAPSLSYADLGAALCEVAERKAEFGGQGISASATGKVKETWATLLGYLAFDAKNRILGWMSSWSNMLMLWSKMNHFTGTFAICYARVQADCSKNLVPQGSWTKQQTPARHQFDGKHFSLLRLERTLR